MSDYPLLEALEELESAEDFLEFFAIPFDPAVVHVNRLHILQRFHDYLAADRIPPDAPEGAYHAHYHRHLERAYRDFVASDARTEKVFKVFHMHGPQTAFVPADTIRRAEG